METYKAYTEFWSIGVENVDVWTVKTICLSRAFTALPNHGTRRKTEKRELCTLTIRPQASSSRSCSKPCVRRYHWVASSHCNSQYESFSAYSHDRWILHSWGSSIRTPVKTTYGTTGSTSRIIYGGKFLLSRFIYYFYYYSDRIEFSGPLLMWIDSDYSTRSSTEMIQPVGRIKLKNGRCY